MRAFSESSNTFRGLFAAKSLMKTVEIPSLRVALIGAGKLAWSLIPALQEAGAEIVQLISRDAARGQHDREAYGIPVGGTRPAELLPDLDLVLLTVSDASIPEVVGQLAGRLSPATVLAHCSGSVPLSALSGTGAQSGVFYPLQLFTRAARTPLQGVPFFLEGNPGALELLQPLATAVSGRWYPLDSAGRRQLHLAAVWACNFPNLLFRLAESLMPAGMDFRVYEPLVRQHIDKVFRELPAASQTGPALRGDLPTLQAHLQMLADQPALAELYRTLSDLIRPGVWEGQTKKGSPGEP